MSKRAIALALSCIAVVTTIARAEELPNIPIVESGWQEKFWTHSDGTKFHYLEMGKGTPVILIHGSGGTAMNWMANGLGASLAKTNRVIAIDMRAHGQTVGPDGKRQQRTPNMDLDVLAFMDALQIKKAHIGGFSMGGAITSQVMARAPERFITAHFGGSGVRELEGSEFAKMVPRNVPARRRSMRKLVACTKRDRRPKRRKPASTTPRRTIPRSCRRSPSPPQSRARRSISRKSNSQFSPWSANSISTTRARIGSGAKRRTFSA